MITIPILRVARVTHNLAQITAMYCQGLDLDILAQFDNDNNFDGVMLGKKSFPYHLEFTYHQDYYTKHLPLQDNLIVFYLPEINIFDKTKNSLLNAGFIIQKSFNPYWDRHGITFEDIDNYRIVISTQNWVS